LEVGLGGRLDATNVIQKPVACGISALGFDHMEILGDTLEKIAFEKAGIIKSGITVISQPQREEALTVLQETALKRKSPLLICPSISNFGDVKLGLKGKHQELNASLALSLSWYFLASKGVYIPLHRDKNGEFPGYDLTNEIKKGLEECRFPGRGDVVKRDNNVAFYLDGAHTIESLELAVTWFASETPTEIQTEKVKILDDSKKYPTFDGKAKVLVFNFTPPRDPSKLIIPLKKEHFDLVVFCPMESSKVSLEGTHPNKAQCDKLKELCIYYQDVKDTRTLVADSIEEFLDWTRSTKDIDVFITGSLYLVGDFIKKLNK
jgi:folylpolyglutamate synthase